MVDAMRRAGGWVLLGIGTAFGQVPFLQLEFPGFFSGRPDPLVAVGDSARARQILDAVAVSQSMDGACAPRTDLTLGYNGVRLWYLDGNSVKRSLVARSGCLSDGSIDPGWRIERMAVAAAFREDDLNHPGGPAPFADLACLVPDTLRPAAVECQQTTSVSRLLNGSPNSLPRGEKEPTGVRADGGTVPDRKGGFVVTLPGPER